MLVGAAIREIGVRVSDVTVHLLWWHNRHEYEDAEETLLGIYADYDSMMAAQCRFELLRDRQWPFNADGVFSRSTAILGEDIVKKHPSVV